MNIPFMQFPTLFGFFVLDLYILVWIYVLN